MLNVDISGDFLIKCS